MSAVYAGLNAAASVNITMQKTLNTSQIESQIITKVEVLDSGSSEVVAVHSQKMDRGIPTMKPAVLLKNHALVEVAKACAWLSTGVLVGSVLVARTCQAASETATTTWMIVLLMAIQSLAVSAAIVFVKPNVRGNLTVEAGGVSPDGQDAES